MINTTWCSPPEELSKKTKSELEKVKLDYEAIKQKFETKYNKFGFILSK